MEANLILSAEGTDVLELDVVAAPANNDFLVHRVYDAKTDDLSFKTLFKIAGWARYLGIDKGYLIYRDEPDTVDFLP